jgi:hypothetical protein
VDSSVDPLTSSLPSNRSSNRSIAPDRHYGLDILLLGLAQTAALVLEEPLHARVALPPAADP